MARTELDRAVLPSLLDRLTDEAPREPADPPTSREESARRFRQSVQRDLDWLLNTRRTIVNLRDEYGEVAHSVHQYGLPDFAGTTTSHADWREHLVEDVRETIRLFEPRLANVLVHLVDEDSPAFHQIRFSVTATLLMDPSPEQVVFDTLLDVASGTYELEDRT